MAVAVSRFGMVDESSQNVHPFFTRRDCANPPTLPPEEFGNQRKRRRISSSTSETSVIKDDIIRSPKEVPKEWEIQLRAAAYGEQSVAVGPPGRPQTLRVEAEMEPVFQSKTDKDASSLLQGEISNSRLDEHGKKTRPPPRERPTAIAPRKMIAICAGGKLVSPAPQVLAPNSNVKRKKHSIIQEDDFKPTIVRIKYGSTTESRKLIAQKIQDIMSGATARVKDEMKNLRSFKPAISSKPTHPFFLGASSRKNEPENILESTSDGDLMTSNVAGKQNVDNHLNTANPMNQIASNPHPSANLITLQQISQSIGKFRPVRYSGTMEPIWPPKEMAHVRPLLHELGAPAAQNVGSRVFQARRKLKYAKVHVAEDKEILQSYSKLLRQQAMCKDRFKDKTMNKLGQPTRKVMTGSGLQAAAQLLLSHRLSKFQPAAAQDETPGGAPIRAKNTHSALLRLFENIHSSSTAFDRFECEIHDWTHKYAPKCAEEVLQSGSEALVLRDWLKSLTVTSVGSGSSEPPSRKLNANFKRRKRKRAEELDGFVISSDEENVEMEELACPEMNEADYHFMGKKSIVRAANILGPDAERKRAGNAIVISGPHGCGKTAAVYAVARELDFEVFEINPGSRRSGKDILEKVGDMTKNHLVKQACESRQDDFVEGITDSSQFSVPEVDSRDQKNVEPVLQPHAAIKKKRRGRPGTHALPFNTDVNLKEKAKRKNKAKETKNENERKKTKKQKQSQKQSLILLEEVDVLFEEDKQFWSTTLDLILHSKRPIIMTCSDERLLPLDEMVLFALLRFTPPPEPLAIDYLILIASSEGHLLSRNSVLNLLRSKDFDLRASITELNFFCQMAIGDTKGGLEWILIQPSFTASQRADGTKLRVVSLETYGENLNSGRQSPEGEIFDNTRNVLSDNRGSEDVDQDYFREGSVTSSQSKQSQGKRMSALQRLAAFERTIDALSAADTHLFSDLRQNDQRSLDPTQPNISNKSRMDFVESSTVLNAEPVLDHSGVSTLLGLAVETYATQMQHEGVDRATNADNRMQLMPEAAQHVILETKFTRTEIVTAFDSITGHSKAPVSISSFDGPMSSIVQDLAPYVRSIVYSDMKLEEHRLQLSSLLAQNGRNGKRMRTTRASHAALEGGSKAHTRRERWFPGDTDIKLILQSGGIGWQELAWKRTLEEREMDSKQDPFKSSTQPSAGNDTSFLAEHSSI